MKIGVAQLDITPPVGVDLCGYAARIQPSTGVMDPLSLRALYIEHAGEKLLWLHADVIALNGPFVDDFRSWAESLSLPPDRVLLTATHTHAGPVTVHLTACGIPDEFYLKLLREAFRVAAVKAMSNLRECFISVATAECRLAIDRRNQPSAHTDPVVTAIGFRDPGTKNFLAVIANYAMHPTALGHTNRAISADWPGYAAEKFHHNLPGNPVVLMTNGACGNINPPKQNITQYEVRTFGEEVAGSVIHQIASAAVEQPQLRISVQTIPIPLDTLTPAEIDAVVDSNLTKGAGELWAQPWVEANEAWRRAQKSLVEHGKGTHIDIELFAVRIGPMTLIAINGEIFSRFTAMVRESTNLPFCTVTYANRAYGYIPTRAAYAEGGYEVDQAHYFYNTFRPKPGALELLAERAGDLVKSLQ